MTRTNSRLDLVQQVFAKRELVLIQELSQFQSQLDQAVQQLKQLRDHRDRHAATLRSASSTDPGRMQNRLAFQQRLNEAISQQELLINRAEIERGELRQRWLARRRKTLSVEKLCEIRTETQHQEDAIREQRHQDEITQRLRRVDHM